jgi:hypothetical protein
MAAIAPLKRPNATSVVQSQSTGSSGATRKAAISSRELQPQSTARITAAQVSSPESVARAINDSQAMTAQALATTRSNPMNAGSVLFQNVSVTLGVPFFLPHNMGRPFVGYLVTRRRGVSPRFEVSDACLPPGLTASQVAPLIANATGIVDILVF